MMKRFVRTYFGTLLALFVVLYLPTSPLSLWFNELQTSLTLHLIEPFLHPGQLQGIDIWITPHYKIYISKACNGFIPIFFLWAAIVAYPALWQHRVKWIVLSYLLFSLINAVRIVFVVKMAEAHGGSGAFYWSHDLLGNGLLIFSGLGMFILFIKSRS
jgi:exosortase/archaeosortase family protein